MGSRRSLILFFISLLHLVGYGQEGSNVFSFLKMPASAHTVGMGGSNVSFVDDNPSLFFQNPAMMSNVSDRTLGLNFLTYMKGVCVGSASYCQAQGTHGTWGVGAMFQGYGRITETTASGESMGSFSPIDLYVCGGYSYNLSDYWSGGAVGKIIYSHYGEFTSCALAADIGLNYFDPKHDFSFGIAARNLGGQVKRFGDHGEKLPIDLEAGISLGLGHAPINVSLTLVDLTCWSSSDYYSPTGEISGGRIFANHLCFGVDVRPIKALYLTMGYSLRRGYEMQAAGASHAAGLSFGIGCNVKKFKAGFSYAQYHVSMPTFAISLAYSI